METTDLATTSFQHIRIVSKVVKIVNALPVHSAVRRQVGVDSRVVPKGIVAYRTHSKKERVHRIRLLGYIQS